MVAQGHDGYRDPYDRCHRPAKCRQVLLVRGDVRCHASSSQWNVHQVRQFMIPLNTTKLIRNLRCPTECRLSYSMEPWTCRVSLRFTTDAHGQPIAVRTIPFGDPISDKAEVADRIKRGQQAILNPQLSSSVFLNAHPADSTSSVTFSTNCILLEISGPDVPDLTLVDLPGANLLLTVITAHCC